MATSKAKKGITSQQQEIADFLSQLGGYIFVMSPKEVSGYITLDLQLGKPQKHKNAVSVFRNSVSFMVSDFHAEDQAEATGLKTQRNEKRRTLRFPGITLSSIQNSPELFTLLLKEAGSASTFRQKPAHL